MRFSYGASDLKELRNSHSLTISRLPFYKRIMQLAKERKDAILIDVGCCCAISYFFFTSLKCSIFNHIVGHELRKIVADGWPAENVVGFELVKGEDIILPSL